MHIDNDQWRQYLELRPHQTSLTGQASGMDLPDGWSRPLPPRRSDRDRHHPLHPLQAEQEEAAEVDREHLQPQSSNFI